MKRTTLVILISVIAALSIAASGCTYTTGGQNATQNATQNASHVNIRLPLSNLFGYTTTASRRQVIGL
jgi:flagellar basal body-associated protein FliL